MSDLIEPQAEPTFAGPLPVETPEATAPAVETPEETPAEPEVPQRVEDLPDWAQNIIKEKREGEDRYRRELREYEAAFEGYTPDERQAYLDYARLVRAAQAGDPQATAQLEALMREDDEPEANQPQYLTREEAAELARQEAQRVVEAAQARQTVDDGMNAVFKAADEFGFKDGTEDRILFLKALNEVEDPSSQTGKEQARQMVVAYKQAIVDEYLKSKEAEAANTPSIGSGNGVAPAFDRAPKSFAEARASLHERLERLG